MRRPPPAGGDGPRCKGYRIGTPAQAAATAVFQPVTVARYGRTDTVSIAVIGYLWCGVFGPRPVRLVLVNDRDTGPTLALVTTDLTVTGADLVARYATRPGSLRWWRYDEGNSTWTIAGRVIDTGWDCHGTRPGRRRERHDDKPVR